MKCPKCGAFIEDGKTFCFMCGTNLENEQYNETPNNNFNQNINNTPDFSSFNNQNQGFSNNQTMQYDSDYLQKKEAYNNRLNDYKNIKLEDIKTTDRDIFDFFSENKKMIGIVFLIIILSGITFGMYSHYRKKAQPVEKKPLVMNLYYEVDESFSNTGSGANSQVYAKSGNKGSDCSITVAYGTGTEEDHVNNHFATVKSNLAPERDNNLNVITPLLQFTSQESEVKINNATWYYLNIFYRNDLQSKYTIPKQKHLTSLYKGYYYDITLINNSNDSECSAALDNFTRTLEFIEIEEEK